MSWITSVVIYTDGSENFTDEYLRLTFDTERNQSIKLIDCYNAGGTKVFTGSVFVAALNHINQSKLREWIVNLEMPIGSVAIIHEEQRDSWIHKW